MAASTRSGARLALLDISDTSPTSNPTAHIIRDSARNKLGANQAQEITGATSRCKSARAIPSLENEPDVPTGANASSLEPRLMSTNVSPSTPNSNGSPTLKQRTVDEHNTTVELSNINLPRVRNENLQSQPPKGSTVAFPAIDVDTNGRPDPIQEANRQIAAVQRSHRKSERLLKQKLSGQIPPAEKSKSKEQDERIRKARLVGLSKVSIWHRKVEFPANDDTDGEDSEDELIKEMVMSHDTWNVSHETSNVGTRLGDASRAIRQVRRRQKMNVPGEKPEVHLRDREVLARLEANRTAEENRESDWAAAVLWQMSFPAIAPVTRTLAVSEEDETDTGSIAAADSEPEQEDAASDPHMTNMMEPRMRQQRNKPNLSTYQRIRAKLRTDAEERLRSFRDQKPNPDVAAPTTAGPQARPSSSYRGKRQQECLLETTTKPPKKRAKTTRTKAKESAPPSAPLQQAEAASSSMSQQKHQQQASSASSAQARTQPRMTSENLFIEIGRQAESGMATAGRGRRRRSAPQNLPQPQIGTN
ncbi:MAG: hypothetical protein Q9217_005187 [Psora testacea]